MNTLDLPMPSLAGHPRLNNLHSREINYAADRWERRRLDDEEWTFCWWDMTFRKPSAIRALIVVQ